MNLETVIELAPAIPARLRYTSVTDYPHLMSALHAAEFTGEFPMVTVANANKPLTLKELLNADLMGRRLKKSEISGLSVDTGIALVLVGQDGEFHIIDQAGNLVGEPMSGVIILDSTPLIPNQPVKLHTLKQMDTPNFMAFPTGFSSTGFTTSRLIHGTVEIKSLASYSILPAQPGAFKPTP